MSNRFFSGARYPQIVIQVWRHNCRVLGTARKALLEHGYGTRCGGDALSKSRGRSPGATGELLWIIGRCACTSKSLRGLPWRNLKR